jgi:hypothetical protein
MTLTPAEEEVVRAANEGRFADFTVRNAGDSSENDPKEGGKWGPERTIRAEVIYDLAVGANPGRPTHAKGVQVAGAIIVGTLDFQGAKISRPLVLVKCYLSEPMILIDATAPTISLYGCNVAEINAFRLATSGSLFLNKGFTAERGVELYATHIGGDFDCDGGTFINPEGPALFADGLEVLGNVFLRAWRPPGRYVPFRALGEVRLLGAHIHGDLDCSGGEFEGNAGRALSADRSIVDGTVCLRNKFHAKGEVRFLGGQIRGDLDCAQATFENPESAALNADSVSVGGNILLNRGFKARGMVRLVGARINGDLNCTGGSFCAEETAHNPHGLALSIDRAEMGELFFRLLAHPPRGVVSFVYAKAVLLNDDAPSWPQAEHLWLDGFVYDTIAAPAPTQVKDRLDWLKRQPKDRSWPLAYEQLIHALRRMGHERDARKVAIAKEKALRRSGELGPGARAWSLCLGATVGHGYKPWLTVLWMLLLIMVGAEVFYEANRLGVMVPSNKAESEGESSHAPGGLRQAPWPPVFQPVFYSVDVFLPFVDLHQKSSWGLHEKSSWDWIYVGFESYFLAQQILGWLFTGLLVAGTTGIIKKG